MRGVSGQRFFVVPCGPDSEGGPNYSYNRLLRFSLSGVWFGFIMRDAGLFDAQAEASVRVFVSGPSGKIRPDGDVEVEFRDSGG